MDRAAFVSNFVAQYGVPLDVAERAADRRYGKSVETPEEFARHERNVRTHEKEEQSEITKRFRVCGFTVRNLSQARATKQSPGFPDLFITHDRRGFGLFWECKRQANGKYSEAQREFRSDCERCGIVCLGGDRYDAERYLVMNGFARVGGDGKLTPVGAVQETLSMSTEER